MANIEQMIARQQTSWLRTFLTSQAFLVLLAVIAAGFFLSQATDAFATPRNMFNITRNATFVAIIALGMTFVIITGGIDLSVGSVLMLSSMVCAKVMNLGYGIELGLLAALGTSLLVGLVNGTLIAWLGFPPFVVTLAMMSVARSMGMVTSGNTTISRFGPDHESLLWIGGGQLIPGIPNPVVITLILALICAFVLHFTAFGRHVFALGGNERAAELTGVPVRQVKMAVYMLSALAAGICGVVEVAWLGAVTTNLGTGMELQVIAATVIGGANLAGGAGTVFGALVGASLLEVIRNSLGLLGISSFWQGTFIGSFILVAVGFERVKNIRGRD